MAVQLLDAREAGGAQQVQAGTYREKMIHAFKAKGFLKAGQCEFDCSLGNFFFKASIRQFL